MDSDIESLPEPLGIKILMLAKKKCKEMQKEMNNKESYSAKLDLEVNF